MHNAFCKARFFDLWNNFDAMSIFYTEIFLVKCWFVTSEWVKNSKINFSSKEKKLSAECSPSVPTYNEENELFMNSNLEKIKSTFHDSMLWKISAHFFLQNNNFTKRIKIEIGVVKVFMKSNRLQKILPIFDEKKKHVNLLVLLVCT